MTRIAARKLDMLDYAARLTDLASPPGNRLDNYGRAWRPSDMRFRDIGYLWPRIDCRTLLLYGKENQSGNPAEDGRVESVPHANVIGIDKGGTGCIITGGTSSAESCASS